MMSDNDVIIFRNVWFVTQVVGMYSLYTLRGFTTKRSDIRPFDENQEIIK